LSNTKNPKEGVKAKKDDKGGGGGRKASVADAKSKSVKPTSKTGKRPTKDSEEITDSDGNAAAAALLLRHAALLELSALTDHAEYVNETLWLIGNRTLLSLNLSRNELSDQGLGFFLLALQYQKTFMELHKIQPTQGTGLLRLVVSHNKFTSQSESNSFKLYELLKQRDPLSKAASNTNNPDNDTVSVQSGKESSLGRNQKLSAKH